MTADSIRAYLDLQKEFPDHPGDDVVVIATKKGKLCLIGQFRHPHRQDSIEFPRGCYGEMTPAENAAKALEEKLCADLPPEKFRPIGRLRPNTGLTGGEISVFTVEISGVGGEAKNGEGIHAVHWLTEEEFLRAAAEDRITCGITLAAYMKYRAWKKRPKGKDTYLFSLLEQRGVKRAYLGTLKLDSVAGAWCVKTLREQYLWQKEVFAGKTYLTELPAEEALQAVETLLAILYPEKGEDPKKNDSNLKKLGVVLREYRCVLREQLTEKNTLSQKGFSFSLVLQRWMDAVGGERGKWMNALWNYGLEEKRTAPEVFPGAPLSETVASEIHRTLLEIRGCVEEDFADLSHREFHSRQKTLCFDSAEDFSALSRFLEGFTVPADRPDARRELERLEILRRYGEGYLPPRQRARFLSVHMLSLLASALGEVEDAFPLEAARRYSPAMLRLIRAAVVTGSHFCPAVRGHLEEDPRALFVLPEMAWGWQEPESAFSDPLFRDQLFEMSGLAHRYLDVPEEDIGLTERAQAAAMLLRAWQKAAAYSGYTDGQRRRLAQPVLECSGVFYSGRENILGKMMRLQQPELAAIERQTAPRPLHAELGTLLASTLSVTPEHMAFLEACRSLRGWTTAQKQLLESGWEKAAALKKEEQGPITAAAAETPSAALVLPPKGLSAFSGSFPIRKPVASAAFDSARLPSQADAEVAIADSLLKLQRLILLGPQIIDTPVLSLIGRESFWKILASGGITFSGYGNFHTLLDYTCSCLAPKKTFRFSSMPELFQHKDEEYRTYLRACALAYLRADSPQARKRLAGRIPLEACHAVTDFCQQVLLFSDALERQRMADGRPLSAHYHQKLGWRKDVSGGGDLEEEMLRYLDQMEPEQQQRLRPLHAEVTALLPTLLKEGEQKGRTHFYEAAEMVERSAGGEEDLYQDYHMLVDMGYISSTTHRVTPFCSHTLTAGRFDLLPSSAEGMAVYSQRQVETDVFITMEDLADFSIHTTECQRAGRRSSAEELLREHFSGRGVRLREKEAAVDFSVKIRPLDGSAPAIHRREVAADGALGQWLEHKTVKRGRKR